MASNGSGLSKNVRDKIRKLISENRVTYKKYAIGDRYFIDKEFFVSFYNGKYYIEDGFEKHIGEEIDPGSARELFDFVQNLYERQERKKIISRITELSEKFQETHEILDRASKAGEVKISTETKEVVTIEESPFVNPPKMFVNEYLLTTISVSYEPHQCINNPLQFEKIYTATINERKLSGEEAELVYWFLLMAHEFRSVAKQYQNDITAAVKEREIAVKE